MQAILVRYKAWTQTKPSRFIVSASAGRKTYSKSTYETESAAAHAFAHSKDWLRDGEKLIEGTLPNGDVVFVFNRE